MTTNSTVGTMTELPQFQQVEPSPNRLWKRVRTLESNLGYSNLAFESGSDHRKNQWQADVSEPSSRRRKRRLPRVGISQKVQGAASQREVQNSSSIPALSQPSKEHSPPPWTQPVSEHADLGRGNLPRLSRPPQEIGSSHALEWPPKSSMFGELGAEGMPEETRQQSLRDSQRNLDDTLSPGGLPRAHGRHLPVQGPAVAESNRTGDDKVGSEGEVASQEEESALSLSFSGQGTDAPRHVDVEPQGQQNFLVRTPPLGKKLRSVRAGRFRSLVSPNNKVFSSKVVARVQQGLQNEDDEECPKVLIVGSGTFNPIHKIHIRRFYLARNFLQVHKGMRVVGGILSPSHPTLVRQRHRVRAAEIIPPKHRLSMARAAVGEGSWLAVDPWEVTRKRIMDYMSVLEHAKEVCHETFPGHAGDITILYMCQASQIHHLNPAMLRAGGFGVITVCRPLEKASLLKELSPSFRNIAILVEDSTILSAEMEKTSSNMVRHLLKQGKSVEGMVGKAVARYIRDNAIAERVSGRQRWTMEDNAFMFDQEDKEDRPYRNLPRLYVRRASQMPLQM